MIRIGNAQGFWGDDPDAAARLVAQCPDLDFLTMDYLAEVSLSIMALQRHRDPAAGYARDFVEVVKSLAPYWRDGGTMKLISNAGGLNPAACVDACVAALQEAGVTGKTVAMVGGDDVLPLIRAMAEREQDLSPFDNWETGEPIAEKLAALNTANAYMGAAPIAEALAEGADIVITGRVADPSMAVGPCMHAFGWEADAYDRIAGATIAGHLIECGTQVCGGISTEWLGMPDPAHMGFPIVEVSEDGACVVTKPEGTGGRVTACTVKEQLLYEIGDPEHYISPDATVNFLRLSVDELEENRVNVSGAGGGAPTDMYKVSATYQEGYRASGQLTLFGRDCYKKAKRSGEVILSRVKEAGYQLAHANIEVIGANACAPGVARPPKGLMECVLRVTVFDPRKEAVERFGKSIAPLATSGAQGTTGYAGGRPRAAPVFAYWPCLVPKELVPHVIRIRGV